MFGYTQIINLAMGWLNHLITAHKFVWIFFDDDKIYSVLTILQLNIEVNTARLKIK
jgi:hypothetical protein